MPEDLSHMFISGLMSDNLLANNHWLTILKTFVESHVERIRSHSFQHSSKLRQGAGRDKQAQEQSYLGNLRRPHSSFPIDIPHVDRQCSDSLFKLYFSLHYLKYIESICTIYRNTVLNY
jgi:hypothetical protein